MGGVSVPCICALGTSALVSRPLSVSQRVMDRPLPVNEKAQSVESSQLLHGGDNHRMVVADGFLYLRLLCRLWPNPCKHGSYSFLWRPLVWRL